MESAWCPLHHQRRYGVEMNRGEQCAYLQTSRGRRCRPVPMPEQERDRRELSLDDIEAQTIMELPERTALSIVQPGVLHGGLPVPIGRIADVVPPVAFT